jgi:hypothetical protein
MTNDTINASTTLTNDQSIDAIDRALAAAQARKAAKEAGVSAPMKVLNNELNQAVEPKTSKPKATDEDKVARLAQREAERNERKAARDAARAAKTAERENNKKPAHMSKVEKAAEKLAELSEMAKLIFNDATTNLSAADLTTLAAHIQHFNRVKATQRAAETEVKVGVVVEIVSGDPRYIGKTGVVVKAQRIRCYVNIPGGNNRPVPGTDAEGVYFFTSDCVALPSQPTVENVDPIAEEVGDQTQGEVTDQLDAPETEEPVAISA